MAFETGVTPLTCDGCQADHELRWSRMPVREWQTIRCKVCGGILFEGSTVKDVVEVKLVSV